jgi:hypothetical protein
MMKFLPNLMDVTGARKRVSEMTQFVQVAQDY